MANCKNERLIIIGMEISSMLNEFFDTGEVSLLDCDW